MDRQLEKIGNGGWGRDTLKLFGVTFDYSRSYMCHVDRTFIKFKRSLMPLRTMVATNIEQILMFLLFNHPMHWKF